MPGIRSSLSLALVAFSSLARAQTTVYACTATLVLPGTTGTATITRTITSATTVYAVTTSVQYSTITSLRTTTTTAVQLQPTTITTCAFGGGWPGGAASTSTVYVPTTTTVTGNCGGPTQNPAPPALGQSLYGRATNGGVNVEQGACQFGAGYRLPNNFNAAALSNQNWSDAYFCGACVQVTSAGKTTYAQIVDMGGNDANGLNLNSAGFTQLAPANSGQINIEWKLVSCNTIQGGLIYRAGEGSSTNWLSLQILNSKNPIREVSISSDGGRNWKKLKREAYNHFTLPDSNPGQARVDIRVSDITGKTIQDNNVEIISGAVTYGGGNF